LTTATKEPKGKSKKESGWTKISVIFGVLAALTAVAAFLLPTPAINLLHLNVDKATPSTKTSQNPTSAPNSPGTGQPNERHVAELPLAQGGGAVSVVGGTDLSMPCGSGQSDDQYRQIEYVLPAAYASFTTRATAMGKADEEARVGIQVFIRARQERSDRVLEVRRIDLQANGSESLTADITNARAILLRITCSASTLSVTFTDPRIGRP
jgi:hypothetical protein